VPVYQGEKTLESLMAEILPLTTPQVSPGGRTWVVSDVFLVYDNGPDRSDVVIRELASRHPFVHPVWLSRNYGQHAATIAGMASTATDWIVTLDEDGQHEPAMIAVLLDAALSEQADVVYAKPTNPAPHGALRNAASRGAKRVTASLTGTRGATDYQSFRLVLGTVGRSVAAYAGSGVYLDVALGWVARRVVTAPVALRDEGDRVSGYSTRRLLGHFVRMLLSSGTRVLRLVSILGLVFAAVGIIVAIVVFIQRVAGDIPVEGWASTIVVLLLSAGAILFALGVIAEYIGINVNMAMGKPLYVITSDPADGPLAREPKSES
jgi:undecaprenyl-phosphate 4-deoxy-4-formamido-L-arabinose transferase